ncbi:36480_t:CDS:2, partial [Gigaspora margarita]
MSTKASTSTKRPTYEEMIHEALIVFKNRKGSSRQAIKKYITDTYQIKDKHSIEPSKSTKMKTSKNKATAIKSKKGKRISKSGSVQKPTTRRKPQKTSIAKNL